MMTLKEAARLCGGTVLPEYEAVEFAGAAFDSRTLKPGQLFAALRGETNDGHKYIPNALQAGAAAVLAEQQLPGVPTVLVPDSLAGLQALAKGWRQALRGMKVIALTGSYGKTTTKEMLAKLCACVYRTGCTQKNFNNDIGVPVTLLDQGPETELAVVEMGMNHAGEIAPLADMARPDVAVITNIGDMHLENLGTRENICKEKLNIVRGLAPGGVAVLHGDEPLLRQAALSCPVLWFGLSPDNDLRAEDIAEGPASVSFTAVGFGQRVPVTLPVPGEHNVLNTLAAMLAARCAGVPLAAAPEALADFQNTGDRMRIYAQDGYTVVADSYNAGPRSMKAAFEVFRLQPTQGRRIAVLGDMLELGENAPELHRQVGEQAAAVADLILLVGEHRADTARGAGAKARCFDSREVLVEALRAEARPGDALLFKGSRGMKLETVRDAFFNRP